MNLYSFIPFLGFSVSLYISIVVLPKRHLSRLNKAFLNMAVCVCGIVFFDFLLWSGIPESTLVYFMRLQSLFWIPVGLTFLEISNAILDNRRFKHRRKVHLIYGAAMLVSLLTPYVAAGAQVFEWGNSLEPGPLFFPYILFLVVIPSFLSFYALIRRYGEEHNEDTRQAVRILILGSVATFFVAIYTDIILPGFFTDFQFVRLGSTSIVILLVILYVVVKRFNYFVEAVEQDAYNIFQTMENGILILNMANELILANNAALRLLGSKDQRTIKAWLAHTDQAVYFSGGRKTFDIKVSTGDKGRDIHFSETLISESKEPVRRMFLLTDVSDRTETQRALIHARENAAQISAIKKRLLSHVSAQLKHPIRQVLDLSALLLRSDASVSESDRRDHLHSIHGNSKRLMTHIETILDLSELEDNTLKFDLKEVQSTDILIQLKTHAIPLAEAKNLVFEIHAEDDFPDYFVSDESRVLQILKQLLSNAIAHTQTGSVTLSLFTSPRAETGNGKGLYFTVEDTGPGLPAESHPFVFELFNRMAISSDSEAGAKGLGIGLGLCKRIAKMLSGDIIFESVHNKGSKFTLYLPEFIVTPS